MWNTSDLSKSVEKELVKLVFGKNAKKIEGQSLTASSTISSQHTTTPLMVINISATIISTLITSSIKFKDFVQIDKDDSYKLIGSDYVSVDMLKPYTVDGIPKYLENGGLINKNKYWNPLVEEFYKSALDSNNKMVLILDITNSRVNAEVNIRERAEMIQNIFKNDIVCICVHGSGIDFIERGKPQKSFKKGDIGMVLNEYDNKSNIPVIIIGYSQMIRGISYRSSNRVPTHILNQLGKSTSIDNVVQSIGRGTGNFKSNLHKNGYEYVTILASEDDFNASKNIYQAADEMIDAIGNGKSPLEDIDKNSSLAKAATGNRTIGNKRLRNSDIIKENIINNDNQEDDDNDVNEDNNIGNLNKIMNYLESIIRNNSNGLTEEEINEKMDDHSENSVDVSWHVIETCNLIPKTISELKKQNKIKFESNRYKLITTTSSSSN